MKKICVTASPPNFILAKSEEITRLLNQENAIISMDLIDEQYIEHERRFAQEYEQDL